MSSLLFVYMIPVAGHHAIHQASMDSHRYDSFWNEIFGGIMKRIQSNERREGGVMRGQKSPRYHFKSPLASIVYSYFEKDCRKKCTRQSRKVLWVVLSALFLKEI